MSNESTITGQSISTLRSNTLARTGIMNDFDSIRIGIASPEKIREWSYGEVKNRNYKLPHAKTGKRRTFLRKNFPDPLRTGSATAVNINVYAIKA